MKLLNWTALLITSVLLLSGCANNATDTPTNETSDTSAISSTTDDISTSTTATIEEIPVEEQSSSPSIGIKDIYGLPMAEAVSKIEELFSSSMVESEVYSNIFLYPSSGHGLTVFDSPFAWIRLNNDDTCITEIDFSPYYMDSENDENNFRV